MNDQFVQCRTSPLSKLGRYAALYLYPAAGIVLLIASIFLIAGLLHTMDVTFVQLAVSLALLSGATSLSFFSVSDEQNVLCAGNQENCL